MTPWVVLPTYNEAENIDEVLRRIRKGAPDVHVLVVDDSSPDGTAELAERFGAELGEVDVVRRPTKSGLGSAYRYGFGIGMAEGADVLIEMDADLSHDPQVIPALLSADRARRRPGRRLALRAGRRDPELVVAPAGPVEVGQPLRRRACSASPCATPRPGFRAYRAEFLRRIDLDAVRADGYGFQIEMAYRIAQRGGRVVEVPISFADRERGTSKMSGRIVVEALVLVTGWGVRDRARRLRSKVEGAEHRRIGHD